jgi:hypothetical protein
LPKGHPQQQRQGLRLFYFARIVPVCCQVPVVFGFPTIGFRLQLRGDIVELLLAPVRALDVHLIGQRPAAALGVANDSSPGEELFQFVSWSGSIASFGHVADRTLPKKSLIRQFDGYAALGASVPPHIIAQIDGFERTKIRGHWFTEPS